jgi:hypothetical protein
VSGIINSNEVKGDNLFKGKRFYLFGEVQEVTKDIGGNAIYK